MSNPDKLRGVISQIKEMLGEEKNKIADIESLVKMKIERDVGLWEYSYDELEGELFKRYSILEGKKDSLLSPPDISSPRKGIGWLIVLLKKAVAKITRPYSRMVLDRQDQFNRELIPLLLAAILSLQQIKDRLNAAEGRILELIESQKEFSGTHFEKSKFKNKVDKN